MKTYKSLSTVNCHWKKLLKLGSAVLLGAALLGPHPVAAQALGGTIRGHGTASDGFSETSAFSVAVNLLSDGSATGHFGNIQRGPSAAIESFNVAITSWSYNPGGPIPVFPYFVPPSVTFNAGVHNQLGYVSVRIYNNDIVAGAWNYWSVDYGFGPSPIKTVLTGQIQIVFN